jgi:C4-dicarboxylate transporter
MVDNISPIHSSQHNNHATIHIGHATQDQIWSFPRNGMVVGFKIVGMVITDSIQAAVITFVDGITDSAITSGYPHITISTATGVAPKMAKNAIKNAIKNGTVIPSSDSAIHYGIVSNNR